MRLRIPTITTLVLAVLVAAPAGAAFVNPIVDLGSGYAKEDARLVDVGNISVAGDTLTIVGHVALFQEPFDDLDAADPTQEYTYVYRGLVSQGTVVSGSGLFTVWTTTYTGGVLEIYCDPSMDSDFADMSTFMNGDLILEAALSGFQTKTLAINCSGNQNADFQFTGGSLFDRVSSGGVGYEGVITGLFSICSGQVPAPRQAEGYFGLSDTKLDIDIPVPTRDSSWGEIKNRP